MDMLVNLYQLPEYQKPDSVTITRVLPPDRIPLLQMVRGSFGDAWTGECETALASQPPACFVAQKEGHIIGFACYDATAKGYFGPIGLVQEERGHGMGKSLLLATLYAMREAGYGYAVIGWCDEHAEFYAASCGAVPIPGSRPESTVYSRMACFSKDHQ